MKCFFFYNKYNNKTPFLLGFKVKLNSLYQIQIIPIKIGTSYCKFTK